MIAIGCSVTSPQTFERLARRGIDRVREPDTEVLALESLGNPTKTYNAILDRISERGDLEGVALIHQDLELVEPAFCGIIRERFADEDVAVLGIAGGRGVDSIAWWECEQILGCWQWTYDEDGGGVLDAREWNTYVPESAHGSHDVDSLDGIMVVLSPWAARELRFDEAIGPSAHGWDADICFQARAAGKRVQVAELGAIHHHGIDVLTDPGEWTDAYIKFERKWRGRKPGVSEPAGRDWELEALRARADASIARIEANEISLRRNEAAKRFEAAIAWRDERIEELEQIEASRSWRLTAPLRRLTRTLRR